MGRAKEIELKVIPSQLANDFIKKHHYSGKIVNKSKLHFGAFLDGRLHGALSYGTALDHKKMQGLVEGTGWNEFLELNRMAFDDYLPKFSESRCISQSIKLIKRNAPQIKWIVSFADACSCGDGTIYRASNFVLTAIRENKNLVRLPNGEIIHKITLENNPNKPRPELNGKCYYDVTGGKYDFRKYVECAKGEVLNGYQLRYVYFIDKSYREKLTVPEIPYKMIREIGAGMYRGEKR